MVAIIKGVTAVLVAVTAALIILVAMDEANEVRRRRRGKVEGHEDEDDEAGRGFKT